MKTLKLRIVTTLLLGGLLAGGAVRATTFTPLTLVQQARKADVIVQATIGIPTTVTEGTQVYAVYPLKVSETLAGDAATLPQTVGSQGGGSPALFILSGVEGAPVFQSGQEAVLLLYKGRLDSPLVGFTQGAYLVANGQVSVLNAPLASAQGPGAGLQPPVSQVSGAQTLMGQVPTLQPSAAVAGTSTGPAAQAPASSAAPASAAPLPGVAATPVGTPAPVTSAPPVSASPTSGSSTAGVPVPTPPVPELTTASEIQVPTDTAQPPVAVVQPAAAVVPATSAAAGSSTTAPASALPGGALPATGAASGASALAPAGVLGNIRTPAELKAAIVAARAGK